MGGLGGMLGGALGGGGPQPSGGGMGGLGGMLGGGLGGLGQVFEQAGYGEHMKSWVSTGENKRISADDLGRIFGPNALGQLARHAGVSEQEAAGHLSTMLPQLVDGLTPAGALPRGDDDVPEDALDALVGRLTGGGAR